MKSAAYLLILASLELCVVNPSYADIYFYSGEGGTVILSNFKQNSRFETLIPEARDSNPRVIAKHNDSVAARKHKYQGPVYEVSRVYGLDSALLHAIIHVESRYQPSAVSRKGATGLMQLMPATAKRYGVVDLFDPWQNLHGGAQYLRYLLDQFHDDVPLALAAYNAGENAVMRFGRRIPPFRETMNYVGLVQAQYIKNKSEMAE